MKAIDSFSLEQHAGVYELWPRRTRLFFKGIDTGAKIPGFVIEAQYICDYGYLLVTSQDCPFEESNDFMLLTPAFRTIAHRELSAPYASFLLQAHRPISENAISLHYYENMFMTLEIQKSWGLSGRSIKLILKGARQPEGNPQVAA